MISPAELPNHFGMTLRGQCVSWSGMDDLDRFQRNMSDVRTKQVLQQLGFDEQSITYSYNQCGFRDEEFDDRPCVMALGGSMTEGVGVEEPNVWCRVLEELVGIKVWNLGIGACALDTCFRVLDHYLPILNPKAVILIEPPPARFELFAHYGSFDVYGPHLTADRHEDFVKEYLISDVNADINARKNRLSMTKLCDDAGIPIQFYMPEDIEIDGLARDLAHPGRKAHRDFAHKVYETIGEIK